LSFSHCSPANVRIVWRADIDEADLNGGRRDRDARPRLLELLAAMPPKSGEAVEVPLAAARRWLRAVGTERVDETRVDLAPARHLPSELAHFCTDALERSLLLGNTIQMRAHVAADASLLRPVHRENTDRGAGQHDARHATDDETLGKVASEDKGAVPPHEEQAEVVTAAQTVENSPFEGIRVAVKPAALVHRRVRGVNAEFWYHRGNLESGYGRFL